MNRTDGRLIVEQKVQDFRKNEKNLTDKDFQETETRNRFIDPLFEALGWELNQTNRPRREWDVIREINQRDNDSNKRPDYAFRIKEGEKYRAKFFVEAKAPWVKLTDSKPVFQAKRYAFSSHGKTPVAVLTDFQEFRVFNGLERPLKDKPLHGLIKGFDLKYTDYLDKWDHIYDHFSKDAVYSGSIDRIAGQKSRGAKGLDAEFLSDITGWRERIAKNLAVNNERLSVEELNEAVQRIVDRLVFIRNLEDRSIESDNLLRDIVLQEQGREYSVYKKLIPVFGRLNEDYNGLLFKPHFSETLKVDNKVIADVIDDLSSDTSPYAFDVIEPEILGRIYEKFLGSKIELYGDHKARVQEKPEVRKAGGVFYTPEYIVQYIVKNTLGKLISGKTPDQISSIRIVDPACGSGSFLLGAYDSLIEFHKKWYGEHRDIKKYHDDYYVKDGDIRLTVKKRGEILKNNIYGVDIDHEATEVAVMSLYLKLFADGLDPDDSRLVKGTLLPDMTGNIKCGNSLIGTDYFNQFFAFEKGPSDEVKGVNPFDWKLEFREIFASGGFDIVIGNPPYLNIDDTWGKKDLRLAAIKNLYPEIHTDKTDILFYFIAKSIQLTKGSVSFIVSRAFLEAFKAQKLRNFLSARKLLTEIVDFQNFYVFDGVGITTCIIHLKADPANVEGVAYKLIADEIQEDDLEKSLEDRRLFEKIIFKKALLNDSPWVFVNEQIAILNKKIDLDKPLLADVLIIGKGMETGCNEVFGERNKGEIKKWELERGQYFKRATNSDIQKYHIRDRGEYIVFPNAFSDFEELPKGLREHLSGHEAELKNRAAYKRGDCKWWQFTWPLSQEHYHRKRILCPYMATTNRFALDERQEFLSLTDTTVIFDNDQKEDLRYFLAILNSALLSFRFKSIGKLKSGGIYEYFWNSISKLPIRRIDFSKSEEVAIHNKLVDLVKKTEELLSQKEKSTDESQKIFLERQGKGLNAEIDNLVCSLYGISDEEKRMIDTDHTGDVKKNTTDLIQKTPGICGGRARISNTRIPVWTLIQCRLSDMSEREILENFPGLGAGDLEASELYYRDHRKEIDLDISDNAD